MLFATAGAACENQGHAQTITENYLSTFNFIIHRTSVFWATPKPTISDVYLFQSKARNLLSIPEQK